MYSFYPLLLPAKTFFRTWVLLIGCILFAGPGFADGMNDLSEKYEKIENGLLDNTYGIPIYLESDGEKDLMQGEVYGIIYQPFKRLSQSLSSIKNWCEIMPQHLNIKACTYEYLENQCRLTFYTGRKHYKKADNVYRLKYKFNVTALNDEYFNATLKAKNGPLDTKDYNIRVAAIPLGDESTFFHLSYEYRNGFMTRIAMSTYLATIGRNKMGFSIAGKDENNQPVYIRGIRGVIERNTIRYYFAIISYLNTLADKKDKRFESRISHWFDLTERYHKQLYEMDKADYLKYKRMEKQDQLRLQKAINPVPDIEAKCINNSI
ncbi:MAG: hypothetical protein OQK75_02885 [Gammaproteobacteria bacterium]|nr:hypothetical protein [Gammaproteobacteria bacterium]